MHERRANIRESGFGLIEVMIGLLLLTVALMTHMSGVMSSHRLVSEERERTGALLAAQEIMARLQADEDKAGLYARLQVHALAARDGGELTAGQVRLDDGRRAFLPTMYFSDFQGSPMGQTHVLLDVPLSTPADPEDPRAHVLREDLADAGFALPSDLDGDGAIDNQPRDDDYLVLPVEMTLRWQPDGESARELRMTLWVRGER